MHTKKGQPDQTTANHPPSHSLVDGHGGPAEGARAVGRLEGALRLVEGQVVIGGGGGHAHPSEVAPILGVGTRQRQLGEGLLRQEAPVAGGGGQLTRRDF